MSDLAGKSALSSGTTKSQSELSSALEKRQWLLKQLQQLANYFRTNIEGRNLELQADTLMDIPSARLTLAFIEAIKSCRRMPYVSELRELAATAKAEIAPGSPRSDSPCPACDDTGFVDAEPVGGNRTLRRCHCHGSPGAHARRKQIIVPSDCNALYSVADLLKAWNETCKRKAIAKAGSTGNDSLQGVA